ncbi:hypothetical protein N799_09825 [Lysobacter arseniciresistens ZS79]|uniref:Uncharacterized protein n=1 Tax=Lysobacter arseniciresistens ZS79 TaxID=913325 RepID=A0A0A0EYF4_9GAMM|nr:hypothetical protein [Lysobacter arseniciresistens]KGM54172.1 hypothetical protein N799_09825 [Lysobacter arseniciresistens ZS79]
MSDPIQLHLTAARLLIAAACQQMKADDPEAFAAIAVASERGASFRVTTALSVAGLSEVSVDLVAPDGVAANVARVAFDNPTAH